jgi:hypothetical protein
LKALVAALTLMAVSPAWAQNDDKAYPSPTAPSARGVSPMAADKMLGMAILSAVVRSDGVLVYGSGVVSVTASGGGRYIFTFDRPVLGCAFSVNSGGTAIGGGLVVTVGFVFYGPVQNQAEVGLRRLSDGAVADDSFHMVAFCPK